MQTALHITALVNELKSEAVGGTMTSTEFYKKERAAYLFIKKDKGRVALGFVYHPAGSGTFLVSASKIKIDSREKPWPVFNLEGAVITAAEQCGFDRIFTLSVARQGRSYTLVFEALGPNGNIWLLDESGVKEATLRNRKYDKGEKYEAKPLIGKHVPAELTAGKLAELVSAAGNQSLLTVIEKNVLGFNRTLAKEVVARAGLDWVTAEEWDEESLAKLVASVRSIVDLFKSAGAGYLHEVAGGLEAYPFKLSSRESEPEKLKTLSLAVMAVTVRRQSAVDSADEEKSHIDAVRRAVTRLEKRLVKIEQDIAEAADYEQYKKLGELIQINMSQIKKGAKEVRLKDIYTEPHEDIAVKLEPALTPAENAEVYFKKYRKGREGLELLRRRLVVSGEEVAGLHEILTALEHNFDAAREQYRQELLALLPREAVRRETQPRLPYKQYSLRSGVTIFVGRDGSDNDRTTFEFARPYELWFHTQQCPGSHVVIKYPNKSFEPSPQEIREAAEIAAWFSKAKREGLVPVVYAQRKHVHKPRKAKPGLVTVQREKSIMVTPQKPQEE
ncbi:MAG: NFACT family protein [candidate division Zixibacteria bacterium]|nr:NFACT family protein [candidate division Zixibacteria bacterium]